MATPVIPRSLRLMRDLQAKGIPVFALTNFGIGTFETAVPVYPFLSKFDRAIISNHLGIAKPDPEIYRIAEAERGLRPESLLFVDDRAENIATAAARGWRTHPFENPEGWAARLIDEGLLSEAEAA